MTQSVCTIIAGPNGAGKTTFALKYLAEVANCKHFINADLIASGLSPLSPELQLAEASKLFLKEIDLAIARNENFSFETTLSGRAHLNRIQKLKQNGWIVNLIYLYLPNVEMSIKRVAERVQHGGHDIPQESIIRRYPRSLNNLLDLYAPLCDSTICTENSTSTPNVIFTQTHEKRVIENDSLYQSLQEGSKQ